MKRSPPSYSEAYHQQGNAGGKPIYVRGPPPPPPPPPVGFYPTQQTTVTYHPQSVVVTQPHATQYVVPVTEVHHVGPGICPACRVGVLTQSFTCLGIMCCIFLFPFGFLCLFFMTEKRCTNCGTTFN
ncbi:Brain protein I3 [Armadillidium vulgare]|nr:Brain protein I3 [Armadillidium vulgare]